jgi:hypothetical protein
MSGKSRAFRKDCQYYVNRLSKMGLIDAVRVQNAANLSEVVEKIMFVEKQSR